MANALFVKTVKIFDLIMENKPTIYVLAGANGIGKTSVNPFFIPKGVTYINADDIARQLRERLGDMNVQELANAEAVEQMNRFIAKKQSFAIETNLADIETWQFLIGIQGMGYLVHLNFFSISDVEVCINRVHNRVLQGGHFVRPDIVKMRYEVGLKLLKRYKMIPNRLILTDNEAESVLCVELVNGEIEFEKDVLPDWVNFVLAEDTTDKINFTNIEDVREKYRRMKKD
jgi:predicted ABC-type ATPase